MIKLERPPEPSQLAAEHDTLLQQFQADASQAVWNKDYIKRSLLLMSHNKCAYCETSLVAAAQYLEVEHFFAKSSHPELVLTWSNLLPACRRCNAAKSSYDVDIGMIVDPSTVDPRLHLRWHLYNFYPGTDVGHNTIDVLRLNDYQRQVTTRFEVGQAILQSIDQLDHAVREYDNNRGDTRRRNRILNMLDQLLYEASPKAAYAGTAATVLCNSSRWPTVLGELRRLAIWDDTYQQQHDAAASIAYPP